MTYKKFSKLVDSRIVQELSDLGFCYSANDKFFFSFYQNIVFRIKLLDDRFSSLQFEHNINVKNENYELFPEIFSTRIDDLISITKWDYSEIKEHNEQIDTIIDEMLFVIKHYIINIASSIVNEYDIESYIMDEYEEQYRLLEAAQGPFTDSDQFVMNYLADGNSHDSWSIENDEEMYEYLKEKKENAFTFEEFNKKILSVIDENMPKYELDISNYKECTLKSNSEIKKINIRNFLFKTTAGKKIIKFLKINNYLFYNDNGCYKSLNMSCFTNQNGYEIFIHIKQYIFLEIEIIHKKEYYNEYLYQYDFSSFAIGWLLGNPDQLQENVSLAIAALEKKLQEIS